MLAQGLTGVRHYGADGERRMDELSVFVQSFAPPPRMLVFGAIDFAAAVARIGKFLGYRVTVCDARPVFATTARFPEADEVVIDWPHRYLSGITTDDRTVICVLTHDPKFDVPVLEVALRAPAAYIGAMGSRRTHEDRLERLGEAGLTSDELARLRSPVGLDLAARDAVIIALVDQPLISPEAVRRLIAAFLAGAEVAVACYQGRPRNPVLIGRAHWADAVAAAQGDADARSFLRARPELVTMVECGDVGRPDDLDTPDDLRRIAALVGRDAAVASRD